MFLSDSASTQVYKWVPANLMLGVTLQWTSIPSRGSRNTPHHFMLQKHKDKLRLEGPLCSYADLTEQGYLIRDCFGGKTLESKGQAGVKASYFQLF